MRRNGALEGDALWRLVDEADCRRVLMRYGPAVDWRDAVTLEALFWPDADIDLGPFKGQGRDAPAFLLANAGQSLRRCHVTTGVSLRLDGDRAYAESAAITHAVTQNPAGGRVSHAFIGRYLDRLDRRDGVWRIARRRYLLHGAESRPYEESPALAVMTKADGLGPEHPYFNEP
jgi:hypothetical protein